MKSIVILISGRGSNMESLLGSAATGALPVTVAAVISNRPDAKGLETAAAHGVSTVSYTHLDVYKRQREGSADRHPAKSADGATDPALGRAICRCCRALSARWL